MLVLAKFFHFWQKDMPRMFWVIGVQQPAIEICHTLEINSLRSTIRKYYYSELPKKAGKL